MSQTSDIVERVLSADPVDTQYFMGRWHRDRANLRGIRTEARVFVSSHRRPRNKDIRKFVIIGRARSGTTLLRDLLDSHPDVRCDGEVLHSLVIDPIGYLENLAAKSTSKAYGAKLLSYQMVQVQRFRDPAGFLGKLHDRDFKIIHLVRDTFDQTLSLMRAQASGHYHSTQGRDKAALFQPDIEDFRRRYQWNEQLLEYERHILKSVPYITVDYEKDLLSSDQHERISNEIFSWIGVRDSQVSTKVSKIIPKDPRVVIGNYEALREAVAKPETALEE
jgi:hypothetical protein